MAELTAKDLNDLRQEVIDGVDFTLPENQQRLQAAVDKLYAKRIADGEAPPKVSKALAKKLDLSDLLKDPP